MPNSAQVLFALVMAIWVVDVRFAPKPSQTRESPAPFETPSCQSGPLAEAPEGVDFEVVVCAPRAK